MEQRMRAYRGKYSLASVIGGILVALLVGQGRPAHAGDTTKAKKEINDKMKEAMENFDLLEYEEARKLLSTALTIAKKNDLEKDPLTAQVHLRLGIVYFSGLSDAESAKLSFLNAVEIDKTVEIEAAYRTGDMVKLLDEARGEQVVPPGDDDDDGGGGGDTGVDCEAVTGIQHTIQDSADAGADKELMAYVGPDITPSKVSIMYRPQGKVEFSEAKMTKDGACKFVGAIPKKAMFGGLVHYYVAAYNKAGKVVASKGSSGSPNIIEISGGSAVDVGVDENPLAKKNNENGIHKGTTLTKPAKMFVSIAVGTGGGYVTGTTEQVGNEVGCCFAPALLHFFPEIGYFLSPRSSLSLAVRLGFPLGANLPGHATAAPAAMLRYRRAFSPTGEGLAVSGALGGGFIRNTVKLTNADPEMNVDTTLTGPLIVGAGAAYTKALGGPLRFIAELNALAGIPVISEMGTCPGTGCLKPNFGVQIDVNLGLIFGF
jgi:hypothetical protein